MAPAPLNEPIVVVGIGCRFPGDIRNPSQLWDAICSQKDLLTRIPLSRFNTKGFHHSNGERHGSTNVDHAYLLNDDISAFDAGFFGINPREAEAIDPQQRMLLETVYEAIEDAGLTISNMKGSDTAVYVGLMTGDWHEMQIRDPENMPMYMATGTARSIVSNRVSYFFDWKGPSMTIDTACSSSLVALHHAVQCLRNGESRIAVAAGANLILGPEMMIAEANLHMLSPTGRSRMWDAAADGYARGEGFAAVMLKTLSQALADGDRVEYIIRETGVNQDGRTQGITMPNAESQTALIRQVYQRAGLDLTRLEDRCQFFEAHGTGTPRGDPIEARAICDAFFDDSSADFDSPLYVGSVKTVIGHLEGCAGLAGLLKAAEAVRRGEIPPNMHFKTMNPDVIPYSQHLRLPTKVLPWPEKGAVRRASVNSFGFGGTNAHVIIESYDHDNTPKPASSISILPIPIVLSAASENSLSALVKNYVRVLKSNDSLPLQDMAVALASHRSQFPIRATFSGTSHHKLIQGMESALSGPSIGEHKQTSTSPTRILGIFTGQGAQWPCMGKELIQTSPLARKTLAQLQASLDGLPDGPEWRIEDELTQAENPLRIQEAALSQPLCTAVQVMLVDLLRAAHVSFHTVVGHSSGEIGAAYAAGLLSALDAIRIAYYRGVYAKLARGAEGGRGSMMAVGISFVEAKAFISDNGYEGRIAVAASNAPRSVTLAGDEDSIAEAKTLFEKEETFCRLLKVDTAYHSHHMRPCLEPYYSALKNAGITPLQPTTSCNWISSVHGRLMTTSEEQESLKVTYWGDNMANTVLFSQAVQAATEQFGPFTVGLEVGPHPALKGPVTQTTKDETGQVLPYAGCMTRFGNDVEAFSTALGSLWSEVGPSSVDLRAYTEMAFGLQFQQSTYKQLPQYPWDHSQRFWKESRVSRRYRQRPQNRHDLLGARCTDDHDGEMRWRNIIRISEVPWLSGHKVQSQIVFPAAGYLVMAMEAARELAGDKGISMLHLEDVNIDRAITFPEDKGVEVMFHLQLSTSTVSTLEAHFSCYSAPTVDEDVRWQRNVTGVVKVHLGPVGTVQLPPRLEDPVSLVQLNTETFYSSLTSIGLEYTGLFRRLDRVVRRANQATGYAREIAEDSEMPVIIHPALLDASFQTIFAAFCWPGDGNLQGAYVPTHLRSLRIVPIQPQEGDEVTIECNLTESTAQEASADIDIFTACSPRVQLEGLTCTRLDPPSPSDDCELFAQTVWRSDAGSGLKPTDLPADNRDDLELVDLCERLSYSYLRQLNAVVDRSEVPSFIWHHQRIFEFIDYLFPLIESGQHPTIRAEWKDDSHEWLLRQVQRYPDNVDLQLISAVGEHLADVVRGKTTMLEHMVVNNTLDRFYKYGLGFQRANGALSRVARQIAHRYPRMKVLEIGAGTGGATKGVLEQLGDAFDQYVFTDISAGFFEHAREQFSGQKQRMEFRTLNIEEDLAPQGYEDSYFDLIIASNVLHATKTLEYTMQNVRRLLKPGGFLLLLEVTSDILRVKLMMAGLSGWWLGADDGRRYAPTINASQWHDLLLRTGFSGVDQRVMDFQDASKHMTSVMISQAVNDDVALLRNPVAASKPANTVERLVIVGGQTPAVKSLGGQISSLLSHWSVQAPVIVASLEDIARHDLGPISTVLSLTDLDAPVLCGMSNERLIGLKTLLNKCRQLLWVTAGARENNPYSNMSVGLGRSLTNEYPHIRMQFLDLTHDIDGEAARIATAMARLILADQMDLPSQDLLWSVEPEIALDDDHWLIPRILPNDALNRRLNSSRRKVVENVSLSEIPVSVAGDGSEVWLETSHHNGLQDVRTQYSLLQAIVLPKYGPAYLSIGSIERSDSSGFFPVGSTVLTLNGRNSSLIQFSSAHVVPVETFGSTPECLCLTAMALVINAIVDLVVPQGRVLLVDPDTIMKQLFEYRARTLGLSVTVVYSAPGQGDGIFIPRLLPHRHIRALLPGKADLLLECGEDSESLADALRPQHRVRLLDVFQSPIEGQENTRLPSQKDLAEALTVALACLKSGKVPAAQLTPISALSKAPATCTSVLDFTAATTVSTRVMPTDPRSLFRADGSYLLVGCTGGLGQSLTRWMVHNGARHLILTSRSTKKVDQVWLDELKRIGARVHLFELDIANKSALVDMYHHVQRHLPPVVGVANAAMVLSDRLFNDMTLDDLQSVLNPKVAGTAHLDELFSTPTLDFFVLFSSLASVVGNRGQSNYGAANLFMTSLAAKRKKEGLVGSVLDIGMVLGIGYVSQTGIYESTLRKFNYMPISEQKFHVMFTEAIVAGRPGKTDAPAEIITGLHRIAQSGDGNHDQAFWAGNPRFSHYTLREIAMAEQPTAAVIALKKQLAEVEDLSHATGVISEGFLAKLGRILQAAPEKINVSQPLINLGVDSLMAVEVRSWFLKEIDVDIPVLRILGGASPLDLCQDAAKRYMTPRVVVSTATSSSRETSRSRGQIPSTAQTISSATSHTGSLSEEVKDEVTKEGPAPPVAKEGAKEDGPAQETGTKMHDTGEVEASRMSFAQERLWFLRLFLEDASTYNVTMMYRIQGPTVNQLSEAFNAVVQRHHVLRSAYKDDPDTALPLQRLLKHSPFRLRITDGDIDCEFHRLRQHTYDLEHGESIAAVLSSQAPDTHSLVLGFHHIVFDGFSAQIFVKDLVTALSGCSLPLLQHQYADFAQRQRTLLEQGAMAEHIAYWRKTFANLPAPVPLFEFCQVNNRRVLSTYTMHGKKASIPASTVGAFKSTARQFGVTAFHGHLAVLQLLLLRFLDLQEVCIGITDANRTDPDFLETIGFFVNLLPLRFEVSRHSSLQALMQNTRDVAYEALQHSQLPFDALLDELAVPRSTTESPLFQILMNYRMGSSSKVSTHRLEAQLLQFQDARNPYDMVFDIEEKTDGSTTVSLQSQSYLYSQADLQLLLDAYICLLNSCSVNHGLALDKHALYDESHLHSTLALGVGPVLELDQTMTISRRIDEAIATQPFDTAVKGHDGASLTYQEMYSEIQSIAVTLTNIGVRPGDFVAVYCEPSIHSVCYLLAIWHLNAIYVPLDPQNPVGRLQLILDDCQPTALIYDSTTSPAVSELNLTATKCLAFSEFPVETEYVTNLSQSTSPACALYTSGSTGVPKGIILTHNNFYNQIMGFRHQFNVKRETVLQQSSLGFDVSLDQMLQPLVGGGTLVVAPRHLRGDPLELANLMVREQVTYTYATPSEYAALLRYAGDILQRSSAWRFAVVGGEALPPHLIRSFYTLQKQDLRLINRYGPTEITVSSSCLSIDTWDPAILGISRVSIGYTLPNYATYILGANGLLLPMGYVGEIVVAGPGVSQGYMQKEELTRERFLPDPFCTAEAKGRGFGRMYRTGDKGRLLPNGELIYLGRIDGDTQVKLRGFRIELADIAQTILREAAGRLADAVVSVRGINDEDGDRRFIVAFATPARGELSLDVVQKFLDQLVHRLPLPQYMIPRVIVAVGDLPRNPNGKLDRRALDRLPLPALSTTDFPQSLTPAEEEIVRVWSQCLSPSNLPTSWSPSVDFFELGGNSLLMVRVQALLAQTFNRRVPLRELFQSSTVQGMAARFASAEEQNLAQLSPLIDWELETAPGDAEKQAAQSSTISLNQTRDSNGTIEVCLTGSTGFLGSELLRHLVANNRVSRIHCVAIRSAGRDCPRAPTVVSEKVVAYSGDLTEPRFGLDRKTWDALGERVDVIIHNGADVSFLKSYHSLRKANVQATRELTCLALPRRVPVHYVSTGGVAQLAGVEELSTQSVKTSPPPIDGSMGYIASKWASEVYLEACATQFQLPCTIHRPSNIVGDGVPSTDLVHSVLDMSLRTQALPTLDNWSGSFDFVPVEDVATEVCDEVVSFPGTSIKFSHHCAPQKVPVREIGAYLEKTRGVGLRTVDLESWLDGAREAGLSGVMESLIVATFKGKEKHSLPSLSREV